MFEPVPSNKEYIVKNFFLIQNFKGELDTANYWGIVIVFEDAYIRREHYYNAACKKLSIDADSDEGVWIKNHIKVVSLHEVERVCLSNASLIDACKEGFKDDPFNFVFSSFPKENAKKENTDFIEFKKLLQDKTLQVIEELSKKGLLQ